jgi:type I restriction enzyme S subunit
MQVITFPHVDILLRWTSAIKAKAEQLLGDRKGTIQGYLKDGIVGPDDAYVIAVNGCRLRSGPFPALLGISQFPFAAEAVFPIGPYQIQIDRETLKKVGDGHQHRPFVKNKNGSDVPAYTFLDPYFAPISAIWAVDVNGTSAVGGLEPMVVIHNPNATNPLPLKFLPSDADYACTSQASDLLLERIPRDG